MGKFSGPPSPSHPPQIVTCRHGYKTGSGNIGSGDTSPSIPPPGHPEEAELLIRSQDILVAWMRLGLAGQHAVRAPTVGQDPQRQITTKDPAENNSHQFDSTPNNFQPEPQEQMTYLFQR